MKIRKAVFPVAGLGTRLLPASKVLPKEMLPIIDRPLLQYAVDEAISAGCDTLIFVINRHKRAIADHFDRAFELEDRLERSGKHALLETVRAVLPADVNTIFVTQSEPLGLGHAILCARHAVGDESFAVLLPDDLLWNRHGLSVLKQMTTLAEENNASVIAVEEVPLEQTQRYGIVSLASELTSEPASELKTARAIQHIIEKPKPEDAPSRLAVVGRYILSEQIFTYLEQTKPGAGGEIQLTDAIAGLLKTSPVLAHCYQGERFDCGHKLGVVEATMAFALTQPDIAEAVKEKMRRLLQ